MQLSKLFLGALTLQTANAIGFAIWKQITEGTDNSDAVAYNAPERSNTLFLNIQIISGSDHQQIINDFKTLVTNYGSQGVSIIPRVRYGNSDGSVATEPNDQSAVIGDVGLWAGIFSDVSTTIDIPVIQAGFLGEWGEWHDGPFCQAQGTSDSSTNMNVKKQVVETLLGSGHKVAVRYPEDHQALFPGNRSVTLHDDCIFNGGPNGYDGGTFPETDRQTWVDYTKQVASGNTFGGEGCNDAGDSTYDWTNYSDLCGSNGLATYINTFEIAYLNPGNPEPLSQLFEDTDYSDCVDAIQDALEKYS